MAKEKTVAAAKIIKMKAEYDKAVKTQSKSILTEIFENFFDSCPEAKIVTWTQGTPSFNDGDPCYFSVHDIYVGTDADADIETPEDEPSFASADTEPYIKHEYGSPPGYKRTETILDAVGMAARKKVDLKADKLYENLDGLNEMMETAFGNGARVKVTRGKSDKVVFDVGEYYSDY